MRNFLILLLLLCYVGTPFYFLWQGFIVTKDLLGLLWFIPLTMVALFQDQLKKQLFSPYLNIDFKLAGPHCLKTQLGTEIPAYYFRVRIKNVGLLQAKLCECVIEELCVEIEGKFERDDTFQPMNLNWSNAKTKSEFLDINPKSPGWFCDLVHIHMEPQSVSPAKFYGDKDARAKMFFDYKQPVPNSQYSELKPNTRHRVKMSVYSENAKTVSAQFEIYWSGHWKSQQKEMFGQLRIEKK